MDQKQLCQPEKETYEAPELIVYGSVAAVTKGSGGNDADDCSSGYWENDPDEE
jgi:hypothetical protein